MEYTLPWEGPWSANLSGRPGVQTSKNGALNDHFVRLSLGDKNWSTFCHGRALVSQLEQMAQPLPSLPLGEGLPALPKKSLDRIWAEEYVDFSELPLARVTLKNWRHHEGHTLLSPTARARAATLNHPRLYDVGTVLCCLYCRPYDEAPSMAPEPDDVYAGNGQECQEIQMAILGHIRPKLSPGNGGKERDQLGQDRNQAYTLRYSLSSNVLQITGAECHALDHTAEYCPLAPPTKRPKSAPAKSEEREVCRRYNDKDKHCNFKNCRYSHTCKTCKGRHPQFLCTNKQTTKESSSSK